MSSNVYYAHIYPHLNYCNHIWSNVHQCHLYNLNVLHKKAIRIMTNNDYCEHTPPLFEALNIQNLTDLSKLNIASHTYKQIKSNNYNTQSLHSYQTRNNKLSLFRHLLLYLRPKTWNDVPTQTKDSASHRLLNDK